MPAEGRGLTSGALRQGQRVRRVATLPSTSTDDSAVPQATLPPGEGPLFRSVCRWVKPVGEPDAANPHVRFDERGVETGHGGILGHRQPKGPANTQGFT